MRGTVQSLAPFAIATPAETAAPETRITEQPAKASNSASATFRFAATDNKTSAADLKVERRLDSTDPADFGSCTSPQSYSGLNEGSHTFDVRAVDQAGNTGNAVGYTWTIDTSAPQTTLDSKLDALTSSINARFEFSSAAGATFECKLDGAPFAECASPEEYSGLSAGNHEFRVRSIDGAGNIDGSPESRTWTVQAQSTCVAKTVTAKASADSWIHQKDSSKNLGTDSVLKVSPKNGESTRVLVRFNLPAVPTGCQVASAELRLHNAAPKSGRTIQALQLTSNWTESGVTWNNQPATTGPAATAPTPSSAAMMKWSVTSQVRGMYTGSNHGFLLRDASEGSGDTEQQFHSREKGTDRTPELVITFN